MTRKISSRWTSFYKIGFPLLFLSGIAFQSYIFATRLHHTENQAPFFAIMGISYFASAILIIWIARFYKHVELDQGGLNVSGYFGSDFIPFSRIESVEQSKWMNGRPVHIHLKESSMFGKKIAFQPRGTAAMFAEHAIVKELRQLAGIQQAGRTGRMPPPVPPPLPNYTGSR